MYAYFPKQTEFYGFLTDGTKVRMLIRKDTLCKIQEVKKNVRKRN
jgi:hypothetical protein